MKVKSVLVPTGAVRGVLGTLRLKTKCHYHGGAKGSGGQLANRNALKSGVYETVVYRRLSEGEQHLFDSNHRAGPKVGAPQPDYRKRPAPTG